MEFRKKWITVLYVYFKVFSTYSSPVTVADVYNRYARVLDDYGIGTLGAFRAHTNSLRSFKYLYVIRNKEKPVHFPVPWEYSISVAGITRLVREGLIPVSEEQHFRAMARRTAQEYNISTRS